MTDENNIEDVSPPTPVMETPKQSREIRAEVAERLKNIGGPVRAAATDILYDREEKRRIDAVVKVVDEIETKERELRKLEHGDIVTYEDADGKVPTKRFSKERIENRKKLTEELGKLNAKLEAALVKNDWSKLLNG